MPQSPGQVVQDSVLPQVPSPHMSPHGPQSAGQSEQLSRYAQTPSPQVGSHTPQSYGQLLQSSPSDRRQRPSPQPAQGPQSSQQLVQVSAGSQT